MVVGLQSGIAGTDANVLTKSGNRQARVEGRNPGLHSHGVLGRVAAAQAHPPSEQAARK